MQHQIPLEEIGPWADTVDRAVAGCVHCGFCLPACPTYRVLGEEMDSPRGRVLLIKEALEARLDPRAVDRYLDQCLACQGCVTACPSGVGYGGLLTAYQLHMERRRKRPLADRVLLRFLLWTVPFPRRFRVVAQLGRMVRPARPLFSARLRAMLDLLPRRLPASERLPEVHRAEGQRRARVALLAGCAQQVLAPQINRATLRVLARNGVEVVIPRGQVCCGALAAHAGAFRLARRLARRNLRAFDPQQVDAVLTNAAGCGSGLREYPLWLCGRPEQDAAKRLAEKAQDVSLFLSRLGLQPPGPLAHALRAVYHDACHLAHAQQVSAEPRHLLAAVPNLELLEIPDGSLCCGSAGSYNIQQPAIANQLGQNKAQAILATGAQAVIAGNIGCMVQIEAHLRRRGASLPVYHTMEVLDQAYGNGAG